jgi:conjugal transfer/entry exclusion protein
MAQPASILNLSDGTWRRQGEIAGVEGMAERARYDLQTEVDVPDHFRERWQKALTTLADLLHVEAALVMRVHERDIEVFATNSAAG